MNYRELVFRICDMNMFRNNMSRESKMFYITKEIEVMLNQEQTFNPIQNEAYEKAFFKIMIYCNKKYDVKGKIQSFHEIILPALTEAGISAQEVQLIQRAFDERKVLIHDDQKKYRWDGDPISVLNY